MRILNVAEKPSVAKSISLVLSSSLSIKRGLHQCCPNIQFDNGNEMVFTSVLGHLFSSDFESKCRWNEIDPEQLFTERIVKYVQPDFMRIKENIEREAQRADMVIIWTDCDREGENIGRQIRDVVYGVKRIQVRRARFSGITRKDVQNALDNLEDVNEAEADAVDSRIELDLRIGSAFTRLQTLSIGSECKDKKILSFGPCQIPTLGFVVERAREREKFICEAFWTLRYIVKNEGRENMFLWRRGSVFDRNCVIYFFRRLEKQEARIVSRKVIERTKYKPLPLRTVELQRKCSSYFKMSGHMIMEIAEGLYNKGYISYPRTETDVFDKKFDFMHVILKICKDSKVGVHASKLKDGFKHPRSGKNNDMAHLPIYPLRDGEGLSGKDRDVYEFVCRRFLGCLNDDAKGLETCYEMMVGDEVFEMKGLQVVERNYLEVYYYEKWDEKEVSAFVEGEVVKGNMSVEEGKTSAPEYLNEAELISLMDKNGIGTDATIHEHIHKIQERGYARRVGEEIRPLSLGTALIDAYEMFGLEVSKSKLRKELEQKLKEISSGRMEGRNVVENEILVYKRIYGVLKRNIAEFARVVIKGIDCEEKPMKEEKSRRGEERKFVNYSNENTEKRVVKENVRNGSFKTSDIKGMKVKEEVGQVKKSEGSSKKICECGVEGKVLEVKQGSNSGRKFYCCGRYPKMCYFFEWMDDRVDGMRKEANEGIKCHCGYEPQLLTANTESNKGRKFYKCKKVYKPCKFFEWEE
ncbi:topoisomerase IA [Ordospora colligata]|uniref:DNA topoisomerase n=1 Tax=Ordospora colligata OC4 TaxID=1354746 RepID=A0A0B2UFU6_9MICR|nr:topoisomerase IA [Ordospora colligata OC4]KHN69956.1 topoisomerase IA [Ordospora colligata OC4]TBU16126.1 topoisomerase IA [Ordospora colligata]TBU16339.1 topoisomerase IA [Ordospora colligata]TBU19043.1 topoisomerase IA [Ordospora colligata]